MAKSVSKFVPKVPPLPGVPGVTRRQQYSASTKKALLEVATRLFAENGYAGASLDAIVAGAKVTKGALYHHFSGKQALFDAVFVEVETGTTKWIRQQIKGVKDPWEQALIGLRAFLTAVQQPAYRRIVIQDGPAVLGYERYREQEERSAFTVVEDIVKTVLRAAGQVVDEEMNATFARIFFGALSSVGDTVADATDRAAAARRVEEAISYILAGIQALSAQGVHLGSTAAEGSETPDDD
ncbi:TetR/AcrR family transcriptional regulator [Nocardioides sp. Iso805N]|uniref:TetR/AcrR family transcriptional regulator n=1 Tax=Nocardioides sp. Iso805N TaxID=1283287 RepID=UPI0003603349|nr:TetR/AcrR family transcriptional regulator [Nocardioides sp. Iso805N]